MALLLKYTKTAQKVHFFDLDFLSVTFNTRVIHNRRQDSGHTKPQLVTGDAASPLWRGKKCTGGGCG